MMCFDVSLLNFHFLSFESGNSFSFGQFLELLIWLVYPYHFFPLFYSSDMEYWVRTKSLIFLPFFSCLPCLSFLFHFLGDFLTLSSTFYQIFHLTIGRFHFFPDFGFICLMITGSFSYLIVITNVYSILVIR